MVFENILHMTVIKVDFFKFQNNIQYDVKI